MHLSIKYLLCPPGKPPTQSHPLVLTINHKTEGNYLLAPFFIFCLSISPLSPAENGGGVGNYAKSEFCFTLFQYAHERKIKGTLNTKRFLQIPWDFDENDFSSAYFLKRTPTSNSLTNSDLILTIFIQKWQSWCCFLSIIVVYKR